MNTHQQVKQHVNLHYASAIEASKKNDLAGVWKVARPVLQLLSGLVFIPTKWRKVIQALLITVDAVTTSPTEEPAAEL